MSTTSIATGLAGFILGGLLVSVAAQLEEPDPPDPPTMPHGMQHASSTVQ